MENNQKPPTQSVGVAGFKADLYANDIEQSEEATKEKISKIEWHILIHLPKFQMYAVEVTGIKYGHVGNVMEWIVGWMQDCVQSNGEQWLFDAYSKWHNDKGYWKQEDVFGKLINEV